MKLRPRARGWPLAALLALSACGVGGPAYEPPSAGVAATVEMSSTLAFAPAEITVRVGETVEWRNMTLFTHTVTGDPNLAEDPGHVALPDGAAAFDSGPVPAGEVFRYTFTTPGTYRYVCQPHEGFDMLGAVVVTPGS
jgi:plastocyanin